MLKTPDASIIEREREREGGQRQRQRQPQIDGECGSSGGDRGRGGGGQAERHCRQRSLNSTSAANCCPRLAAVDDCRDRERRRVRERGRERGATTWADKDRHVVRFRLRFALQRLAGKCRPNFQCWTQHEPKERPLLPLLLLLLLLLVAARLSAAQS